MAYGNLTNNHLEILLCLNQIVKNDITLEEKLENASLFLRNNFVQCVSKLTSEERINQRIFLAHELKKENFFDVYRNFQELYRILLLLSQEYSISGILDFFQGIFYLMSQILTSHVFSKIQDYFLRYHDSLAITDEFLSDISYFPLNDFLGMDIYENPFLRLTFNGDDDLFKAMQNETFLRKEEIKKRCFHLPITTKEIEVLMSDIKKLDSKGNPNVMIYRQMFLDVLCKLCRSQQRKNIRKLEKKDTYEYYDSISF